MKAASGVAGSKSFELPVVFLEYSLDACGFFQRMARFPTDVWSLNTDGLWAENGPDGWVMIPEPISPDRLRLEVVPND